MRFYKEVWGIIWEFNGIGEYVSFLIGRLLGVIVFIGMCYFLVKCTNVCGEDLPESDYKPIPAEFYQY